METSLPQQRRRLPIGGVIRRYALIVMVVALVVAVPVAAYALTRVPRYTAATKVLLRPIPGNPLAPATVTNGQLVTVAMETEAGLVNSSGVVSLAEKTLKAPVPRGAVSASVPLNTQIVAITFTAGEAKTATEGADAFAKAFLDYRSAQSDNSRKRQLNSLQTQFDSTNKSLEKATKTLADASSSRQADAQVSVQLYSTRLSALQESIGTLESADDNPGEVVSVGTVRGGSSHLKTIATVLGGVVGGIGLGAVLAWWRDRSDDRLRASEDATIGGLPILGRLVLAPHRNLQAIFESREASDESVLAGYRTLRTTVIAGITPPSVIVVSGLGFEPVPQIAAGLAVSLRRAGHATVLLDASVTETSVAELLNASPAPGLSEFLLGEARLPDPLPQVEGVRIIPRGRSLLTARELFLSDSIAQLIAELRSQTQFVVIAAPSVTDDDGRAMALNGDHLLLVATDRTTHHREVHIAAEHLGELGVDLFGVVIVPRPVRHRPSSATHVAAHAPAIVAAPEPRSLPATGLSASTEAAASYDQQSHQVPPAVARVVPATVRVVPALKPISPARAAGAQTSPASTQPISMLKRPQSAVEAEWLGQESADGSGEATGPTGAQSDQNGATARESR